MAHVEPGDGKEEAMERMLSRVLLRPNCCCKHPDAGMCLRTRCSSVDATDATCDCSCHRQDEDGFTEWDYPRW